MKHVSTVAAIVLAASTLAALPARAQTAAAPPTIAPAACDKPTDVVSPNGSGAEIQRAQKRIDAYKSCVNDYAKVNNAKYQETVAQAQAYRDAANQAIEEYNAFVTDLNKKAGENSGAGKSQDRTTVPSK